MTEFVVTNIRAKITMPALASADWVPPSVWEIYDYDPIDNGNVLISADANVFVTGVSISEAIQEAQNSAPDLELNSEDALVSLWVDEDLDISQN